MKLRLGAIEVKCIIGDLPHERERPQPIKVDVELSITDRAAFSDALEDTVDYASLSGEIRSALVDAKCRMIERAAKIACDKCVEKGRGIVESAKVTIRKSGAVPGLEYAEAEYESRVL